MMSIDNKLVDVAGPLTFIWNEVHYFKQYNKLLQNPQQYLILAFVYPSSA